MRGTKAFFLIIMMTSWCFAGVTGKIAGVIRNLETKEPLIGASIVVPTTWVDEFQVEMLHPAGAAANDKGQYFILNLEPGDYDIKVMMMGYGTELRTRVRVDADRTTWVNFELEPKAILGEDVVVTAYRADDIQVDLTATRQNYAMSEMENNTAMYEIDDVIALQADVVDDHFRGGRENETLYLVDGGTIVDPMENGKAYTPLVISMEQVQVVTSGFSAEYGNTQSGVVNMIPKQGKNKWRTNVQIAYTAPHDLYWGGSVFDTSKTPWNLFAGGPEFWLTSTTDSENPYFEETGGGKYAAHTYDDTLKQAMFAYAQFRSFSRLLDGNYNDLWQDLRVNFSSGGPITDNTRIFFALGNHSKPNIIPSEVPDTRRDLMVNLTHDMSSTNKLVMGYDYNYNFSNTIGVNNSRDLFFREEGNSKKMRTTQNLRFRWEHVFSKAAFMDLNFRILYNRSWQLAPIRDPNQQIPQYGPSNALPFFSRLGLNGMYSDEFANSRNRNQNTTYSLLSQVSNQLTNYNLLKFGLQVFAYDIKNYAENNVTSQTNYELNEYKVTPIEGALYLEDKLEFEGMIANLGLRWDFYDFNTSYFSDRFSPTRNPDFNPDLPYFEQTDYLDIDNALREDTKPFSRLQPRLGIAFPINLASVVHMNYGQFVQRPGLKYVYERRIEETGRVNSLGNPQLRPEKTNSYDIGVVQGFPFGIRMDVSLYYKDVKDLIQAVTYIDEETNVYRTYDNRDYANIKGFHASIEKRSKLFTAIVRYRYQKATGKSATPFDAPVTYLELDRLSGRIDIELPDPEDIPMDYERTHRLVTSFNIRSPKKFGPQVFGSRPMGSWNLNIRNDWMTGRPYTFDPEVAGQRYNRRTPEENKLQARLQKTFHLRAYEYTVYFEGMNLLNDKVFNYSVFRGDSERKSDLHDYGVEGEWENIYDENGELLEQIWHDGARVYTLNVDFPYIEEAIIYKNTPAYYRMGVNIKF
ncbi:MAG: TonB-dependent receptor [Candidatus Marinimicrobia bacterium]|jgi:outer membrane receptor protein involved in Fe transport|nr:TonB-dependent receptor [Candidatus Neomarinimicrobiota bacterium]MBT3823597.1 TonB-dependent receptor [Candidatus Neomarinimicrobiota bacterium]MBT4129544.1 TonB-dependent receptor [Candidatus Neomarinimicrobiota bacterium]MBT4295930.1 TonB-dependent receptor [Candidatus Neomarinimicrobiota bacterium]MBT4420068.1 TonB-dependent receptor [Candidatus Neomarinimicrobiota bacterium]